jgi:glycosyltransferase involved in cell wall biosynthesis
MKHKIGIVIGKWEGGGISNIIKEIIKNAPQNFSFFIISRKFSYKLPQNTKTIQVNYPTFKINKILRKLDLLHFHGSILMLMKSFINLPSIYTHHGLTPSKFRGSFYEKVGSKIVESFYRLTIPQMEIVTAISKWSIYDVKRFKPKRIFLIPNGIDLDKFRVYKIKKKLTIGEPSLLYVGSLYPEKGVEELIKNFRQIVDIYPKVGLTIIGEGILKERLKNDIQKMGLNEHVKLLGYIPHEKLPTFYNSSDIFIFPSYHESFGLPVIEAMACGVPVIARRTSNLTFLVSESGAGRLFKNIEELPSHIEKVLSQKEKMKRKAIKYAANFDINKTITKYYEVYESLLLNKV